jgi:nucleotide-binding universal stress UspA family protein
VYKTILAYVPSAKRASDILGAAFALSQSHGAHLIALHIHPSLYSPLAVADDLPTGILDILIDARSKEADAIAREFETKANAHDVPSEWRCVDALHGDATQDIIENAFCADLIVTTPHFGDHFDTWSDRSARIVMGTGRPVLLIPLGYEPKPIGERVLVAWNQSREAARAAFDAIPMMRDASHIDVLTIGEPAPSEHADLPAGDDLALALSRHGLKTQASAAKGDDARAGQELLKRLAAQKCDLLVMGCYGHSRVREFIFGGATTHIMHEMTVPVLMSH